MNCFEAKNDFIALWQKKLGHQRRSQLLAHLRGCATCDRSFRIFALTAPVLYSAAEPDWAAGAKQPSVRNIGELNLAGTPAKVRIWPSVRRLNRILAAFVMAAAAAIALYFTAPPRTTFEDAIAADNSNAEVASYRATDNFFGQTFMIQNTMGEDWSDE
jgi:hypothetical protein